MNHRILMVADSRDGETAAIARYLQANHYDVDTVANMALASEAVRASPPELILVPAACLDCPALPMIRALARVSPIAVVFLAESDAVDLVEFLGDIPCVIGVLARPVARDALLDLVAAALVSRNERDRPPVRGRVIGGARPRDRHERVRPA
ncbi:MAG: hypothetical protein U1E76_28045 [Planctomycetota bacterium]